MHWQRMAIGSAVAAGAAALVACGDDTLLAPIDAGTDASIAADASIPETGPFDAFQESGQDAADEVVSVAPPPARLLLTNGGPMGGPSELAVFDVKSGAVDGRLTYAGATGTAATTISSPWLLEPATDLVARLDPLQPWGVRSSWDVGLHDAIDGGPAIDGGGAWSSSEPDAIVVGAGTKAYVLRYTRNVIAAIDTTVDVDGGAPTGTIDLSSQVQAGGDGLVEMTAGYYDSPSGYVFVLLGHIDRSNVASDGVTQLCSSSHPTVVAIDPSTDALVPLHGDGGQDGSLGAFAYALQGYSPVTGSAMVYDPPNRRLLVLERGCNVAEGDGGLGPVVRRRVEAVSLVDGTVTSLLDLSSQGVPLGIFYADPHHVILQLPGAYTWDPSSGALGSAIPDAPSTFTLDGQGHLLGLTETPGADGGVGSVTVVSVNSSDGGFELLGRNPFTLPTGVVGRVMLWPPP